MMIKSTPPILAVFSVFLLNLAFFEDLCHFDQKMGFLGILVFFINLARF